RGHAQRRLLHESGEDHFVHGRARARRARRPLLHAVPAMLDAGLRLPPRAGGGHRAALSGPGARGALLPSGPEKPAARTEQPVLARAEGVTISSMGNNLILIGFMGAGKSSVGRILARRLGRCLVETDEMIVAREGASIPEIFAVKGEAYFRAAEE